MNRLERFLKPLDEIELLLRTFDHESAALSAVDVFDREHHTRVAQVYHDEAGARINKSIYSPLDDPQTIEAQVTRPITAGMVRERKHR